MLIGYIVYCVNLLIEYDYNWKHYVLSPIKQCMLGGGVHSWALYTWFLVTLAIVKCFSPLLLGKNRMGGGLIGLMLEWYGEHYHTIKPYYMTTIFPAMFSMEWDII